MSSDCARIRAIMTSNCGIAWSQELSLDPSYRLRARMTGIRRIRIDLSCMHHVWRPGRNRYSGRQWSWWAGTLQQKIRYRRHQYHCAAHFELEYGTPVRAYDTYGPCATQRPYGSRVNGNLVLLLRPHQLRGMRGIHRLRNITHICGL